MIESDPEHRRPAAVLWDMDGTIVDTEGHWIAAADDILRAHGIQAPVESLEALVGASLPDGAELMRSLGVALPVEELVDHHVELAWQHTAVGGLTWRPGARELLADLRAEGIPLALVTMSYRSYADRIVSELPPATFDAVVTGDDVDNGKPSPDAYLRAMELLDVAAQDCVAIEDSPVGLAAARAAGAYAIAVPNHVDSSLLVADAVWPTLADRGPRDVSIPQPRNGVRESDHTAM